VELSAEFVNIKDENKMLWDELHVEFVNIKDENKMLWDEILSLRQKHSEQQKMMTDIMKFLVPLVTSQKESNTKKEPQTTEFQPQTNDLLGHVVYDHDEFIGEEVILDKGSLITEEWNNIPKISNESEIKDENINSEKTTNNPYDERKEKIERMPKRINSLNNQPKPVNQDKVASDIFIKQDIVPSDIVIKQDIVPSDCAIKQEKVQAGYETSIGTNLENKFSMVIQKEIEAGNLSKTRSIPYKETFKKMKEIVDLFMDKHNCKICDRKTKMKTHLHEHIESKHCSYAIYFCEMCDRQFVSSSHRRHHVRKCQK